MKPIGCTHPNCFICPFKDCIYDDAEENDVEESEEFDNEIIYSRKKQKAIEAGKLSHFNYINSKKGKMKIYEYNNSNRGKERGIRYNQSLKGKERFHRYWRKNHPKKTQMKTIRTWLSDRGKNYFYDENKNIIKINGIDIKVIGENYIAGESVYKTQRDVINCFLIPRCEKEYNKV